MKKFLTLILISALVMTFSIVAFATNLGGSKDVTAKYEQTEDEKPVYNVALNWGDLTFTYVEKTEKFWDPETHSYNTTTTGQWDKTSSGITVTNHSNVAVTVSMKVFPTYGTGVNVTLIGGNAVLSAGEVGNVSSAESVTGIVQVSGKPNSTVTENGSTVAYITVTID